MTPGKICISVTLLPIRPLHKCASVPLMCERERRAAAEPRGFGSRSVAIDLAKCTGSDCGITDAQGERETARKRGMQREEQRRDMTETEVFLWGHM